MASAQSIFIKKYGKKSLAKIKRIIKKFEIDTDEYVVNRILREMEETPFTEACLNDNSIDELVECLETKYVGNESDWELSEEEALIQVKFALTIMVSRVLAELE